VRIAHHLTLDEIVRHLAAPGLRQPRNTR
jgi:hypothetical protein